MKKRDLKKKPLKYIDKVRILKKIYSLVPEFTGCPPDCGKCCGPIICTPTEVRYINHYCVTHGIDKRANLPGREVYRALMDPDNANYCQFLTEDKRCEIWEVRPLICRLFGVTRDEDEDSAKLTCPIVDFPDKKKLSRKASYGLYQKLQELDGWDGRTWGYQRRAMKKRTG